MVSPRNCEMDGCVEPHVARGLCKAHWQKAYRAGFEAPPRLRKTQEFLLAALTSKTKACIVWPYSLDYHGYPEFCGQRGHRFICKAAHGDPVPGKNLALHSCGNRACVNPSHLRWGTYADNTADAQRHGTLARGRTNGLAKLTAAKVRAIRKSKLGARRLGYKYGVAPSCIWSIKNYRTWRHVA